MLLMNIDVYGLTAYNYMIKPHVNIKEDGSVQWVLSYIALEESINFGVNVPDEYKNTNFETRLHELSYMFLFGLFVILLLVILFFSVITFRMIIHPLRKLNMGLIAIKQGELGTKIDYKGYTELNELIVLFNLMTERLKIAEEEAKHISQSKKTLLMNISHDLRTPATVVQGYSQALVDGMVEEEKKLDYYNFINAKSTMITNRLNQLFRFVKLDLTEYDLNYELIDLVEFLRRIVIGYYGDIEAQNMTIEFETNVNRMMYKIDPAEMERAVGNIIENAVKYNGEGTEIRIELYDDQEQIKLLVSDNGVGIPKSQFTDIFSPFVRGDKARKSEGSGLGLAITKQIINKHGGSIKLMTVSRGTAFEIGLSK